MCQAYNKYFEISIIIAFVYRSFKGRKFWEVKLCAQATQLVRTQTSVLNKAVSASTGQTGWLSYSQTTSQKMFQLPKRKLYSGKIL